MAKAAKAANDKSAQLGIEVEKDKQFGKWYTQVVLRASLIEYYDISGCYILVNKLLYDNFFLIINLDRSVLMHTLFGKQFKVSLMDKSKHLELKTAISLF